MSRRFGRNQKRRMRAEIAARDAALVVAGEKQEEARGQMLFFKARAERFDVLRETLPRFMAFMPPEKISVSEIGTHFTIAHQDYGEFLSPRMGFDEAISSVTRMVHLPVMQAWLKSDAIRDSLHVILEYGHGQKWAYAASRESIAKMPVRFFVENAMRSLAHKIHNDMQDNGRKVA